MCRVCERQKGLMSGKYIYMYDTMYTQVILKIKYKILASTDIGSAYPQLKKE